MNSNKQVLLRQKGEEDDSPINNRNNSNHDIDQDGETGDAFPDYSTFNHNKNNSNNIQTSHSKVNFQGDDSRDRAWNNNNNNNSNNTSNSLSNLKVTGNSNFKQNQDFEENPIKVMIRLRPSFNPDCVNAVKVSDSQTIYINNNENVHSFKFNRVFKPSEPQESLFTHVCQPILQHAIEGYNASFIVYGQTGTGKTHTMGLHQNNLEDEHGMIQHSLKFLFDYIEQNNGEHNEQEEEEEDEDEQPRQKEDTWQISISFLQIYIEEIFDLLNPNGQKLQIREDSESNEVYVQNLVTVPVKTLQQALKLIEAGLNYRMLGSQDMNQLSSRSHTILNVYLQQKISHSTFIVSTIAFVDLAGSERIKKSNSTGIRMEEAKKINSSLSALSNVISLLGNSNSQFIPYRDSKLTRILQNCLSSQSKIAIIGTLEPSEDNSFESYSTLLFASRCQDIIQLPSQNVSNIFTLIGPDPEEEIASLKQQLKSLDTKLKKKDNDFNKYIQNVNQDKIQYIKSILEAIKKAFSKPSKNYSSRNSNASKKKYDYVPRFPIEELNALAAVEGKTADFLSLLERSIEDAVTHSQENDRNQSTNKQKSVEDSPPNSHKGSYYSNQSSQQQNKKPLGVQSTAGYASQISTHKGLIEVIEYQIAVNRELINSLCEQLESESNLSSNTNNSNAYTTTLKVNEFNNTTQLKIKDILTKHCSKDNPNQLQLSELIKEESIDKIRKTERLRLIQLISQLSTQTDSFITNSNNISNINKNNNSNKLNSNIKEFLINQKKINDKKYLPLADQKVNDTKQYQINETQLEEENNVSKGQNNILNLINNGSNNSNGLSERSNFNNNAPPVNLKTMIAELKKNEECEGATRSKQISNSQNEENIQQQHKNKSQVQQQQQQQQPQQQITIRRLKILDSDIDVTSQQSNFNSKQPNLSVFSDSSNQSKHQQQQQQQQLPPQQEKEQSIPLNAQRQQNNSNAKTNQINSSVSKLQDSSSKSKEVHSSVKLKTTLQQDSACSSIKSTDQQFATHTMSPIPMEQTLNSQLKSTNFQKKNSKYSPFVDQ